MRLASVELGSELPEVSASMVKTSLSTARVSAASRFQDL